MRKMLIELQYTKDLGILGSVCKVYVLSCKPCKARRGWNGCKGNEKRKWHICCSYNAITQQIHGQASDSISLRAEQYVAC